MRRDRSRNPSGVAPFRWPNAGNRLPIAPTGWRLLSLEWAFCYAQ